MAYTIMSVIVFVSIFIVIPVLIGVYVYRDAKKREMNAAFWALITILAPALIGFIIYLLVRGSYSDLKCPSCVAAVMEQYVACPKCGTKLKASCSSCGFPIEADWTTCPQCASTLQKNGGGHMVQVKKKDTALNKILAAVILIPALLLGLTVTLNLIGLDSFTTSRVTSSTTSISMSVEEYRDYPEIIAWINECDKDPYKVYALRYQVERGKQTATHCLIYRPLANKTDYINDGVTSGPFGANIDVDFQESFDSAIEENKLTAVSVYSNVVPGLKVYVNDEKVDCIITEVSYDPIVRPDEK